MCLSCGCLDPNASHGDSRHITLAMLEAAAEANNSDIYTILRNMEDGYYIFFQQIAEKESEKLATKKNDEEPEEKTVVKTKKIKSLFEEFLKQERDES